MTPIQTIKSPSEVLDYRLTLTGDGFLGDTILSSAISSDGNVAAQALATTAAYFQYQVSAGLADATSLIRIVITTTLGRKHEIEHSVKVVA